MMLSGILPFQVIELFLGKFADNNSQSAANDIGEKSVKNLTVKLPGLIGSDSAAWVGGIWGSNSNGGGTSDSTKLQIYRAGLRGGISENFLTYRGEVLMNTGSDDSPAGSASDVDYKGQALDLGVGLNLPEGKAGQLSFGGNFLWTSGDDELDGDDDSFHDLLEIGIVSTDRYYGEIFGRSNVLSGVPLGMGADSGSQGSGVTILHVNATLKPAFAPKTWWRFDWYDFSATEDSITVPGSPPTVFQRDDFGTEYDATVGYRHSDNVGFEGGFAMLDVDKGLELPGTSFGDGIGGDDNITKWFARVKIAWGAYGGGMTAIDPAK